MVITNLQICCVCEKEVGGLLVIYTNCEHYTCCACAQVLYNNWKKQNFVGYLSNCPACHGDTGPWYVSDRTFIHDSKEKTDYLKDRKEEYELKGRFACFYKHHYEIIEARLTIGDHLAETEDFYENIKVEVDLRYKRELYSIVPEILLKDYLVGVDHFLHDLNERKMKEARMGDSYTKWLEWAFSKHRELHILPIEYLPAREFKKMLEEQAVQLKDMREGIEKEQSKSRKLIDEGISFCRKLLSHANEYRIKGYFT